MAKVVYKSYTQNDNLLFPPCIGDFIPKNDPVRVLDAIVEHLDISAIEATYKGGGASSFAPRMHEGKDAQLPWEAFTFDQTK